MASKRQLEEQDSSETANADGSSKRPRLSELNDEGTSGHLNISNQHPEDAEENSSSSDTSSSEEDDEDNATSTEDDDSAMEEGGDRISRFPALLQDKVFGFLDDGDKVRTAQVCSSWLGAVYRPCHWVHDMMHLFVDYVSEEELTSMRERGICQACVYRCNSKEKMKMLFQNLPALSSLELQRPANANVLLEAVGDGEVSALKSLCIRTDDDLEVLARPQFFRSFPNLQDFSITGRVGSDLLEVIGRELLSLKNLTLLSNDSSSQLNVKGLENFSGLECLVLSSFRLVTFENLTVLNGTLRVLVLGRCKLPKNKWAKVLSQLSSLEKLNFESCTPDIERKGLELVCGSLVNLKKFVFTSQSNSMADRHLKSVAKLSNLQELILTNFGAVTEEGIQALGNLAHLKDLQLENCLEFTARAKEHISQISSLQELHLEEGSHGRVLLKFLSRGTCKLKKLELCAFDDIEGKDMAHIAKMSSLRELHLVDVRVGPTGMKLLSQGTFTLEVLEHFSSGVTIEGLMPLFDRQTCLREVSIVERGIEDCGINFMRTILPNLDRWRVQSLEDDSE